MWPFDAPYNISYRCFIVTFFVSSAVFEIMGHKHIGVTTLTCQGHATSSITWRFDSPYGVSYWCFIWTKSLSPNVFEIFGSKYIGFTTLTFWGHVTSLVMWPFDAPYSISCRRSIVTDSLSPVVSRYWALNILGSRPWPFKVTWRHRSRDDSIPYIGFPIGAPLEPSPYLQSFSRYLAVKCLSNANRHCACAISSDLYPICKIWVYIWISHSHIAYSLWHIYAPYSISYRRSIVTDSSPAVFEILGPKHILVTTLTFRGVSNPGRLVKKPRKSQTPIGKTWRR